MMRGLVIGKFYPPHRGHKFLIDFARSQVDRLVVIVCERVDQSISGAMRKKWLEEIHSEIEVLVVEDILDDNNSEAWAIATRQALGYTPDLVFTSERYGDAYARFLGAKHVLVDLSRTQVPIAATNVRANPFLWWEYLEPCVRAHYAKRVCVLGAESTGTTTLAKALAEQLETAWAPEYGRLYTEARMCAEKQILWQSADFEFIAREQNRLEDHLVRVCNKVLICDTNALATELWHKRYMGFESAAVAALAAERRYDLYVLTDTDIPFVQDGTRDGEHIRLDMHRQFEMLLKSRNLPFIVVSGSRRDRISAAVAACRNLIDNA